MLSALSSLTAPFVVRCSLFVGWLKRGRKEADVRLLAAVVGFWRLAFGFCSLLFALCSLLFALYSLLFCSPSCINDDE